MLRTVMHILQIICAEYEMQMTVLEVLFASFFYTSYIYLSR